MHKLCRETYFVRTNILNRTLTRKSSHT